MSWSQMDFDSSGGTKLLLRRLASSPLVRRTLPNAAAICQQYFSFRRQPAESIGNFLVRETLVHEEFVEAIIRLHDDGDPPPGASPGRRDPPDDSALPRGATGSSPSHRPGESGSQTGSKKGDTGDAKVPLDELWLRIRLSWMCCEAGDCYKQLDLMLMKNEIYSAQRRTLSTLDYTVISTALQTLWNDQLLGTHRHHSSSYNTHLIDTVDDHTAYQHEVNDWWDDDGWGHDWWYEDAYTDHHDLGGRASGHKRTWSEAQCATQALRRDRGFGLPSNASSGKCFICGGNHFARECQDRAHQGGKGGKSYHRNYMTDLDENYAYCYGKGKSQGKYKGKSKKGMALEAQAWMKGKAKAKGKGVGGKDGPRSVNAYSSEFFLGGLEVSEVLEAVASHDVSSTPGTSVIDCGATASAAPEAVVRGLISAVLTQDRGMTARDAEFDEQELSAARDRCHNSLDNFFFAEQWRRRQRTCTARSGPGGCCPAGGVVSGQGSQSQGQKQTEVIRCGPADESGSKGSEGSSGPMALLRAPPTISARGQSSRAVGGLFGMQPPVQTLNAPMVTKMLDPLRKY
ncbi:unnamed protein product, partial [Symbiodinium necroappetens]